MPKDKEREKSSTKFGSLRRKKDSVDVDSVSISAPTISQTEKHPPFFEYLVQLAKLHVPFYHPYGTIPKKKEANARLFFGLEDKSIPLAVLVDETCVLNHNAIYWKDLKTGGPRSIVWQAVSKDSLQLDVSSNSSTFSLIE